jgi:PDZ domain-containing protein
MKNKIHFNIQTIIAIIIIVFCLAAIFVRVPYQVEMPGGTINLESRIIVDGEEQKVSGSFNMAYVSVVQRNLIYTLIGLVHPDWEVEKISDVTFENETIEDSNRRDKLYLEQSKDYAIATALKAANLPYEIVNLENNIVYIAPEAKTDLKVGDILIECNGKKVESAEEVKALIDTLDYGTKVNFKVLRDKKEVKATGEVVNIDDQHYIGISITTTFDIKSELDIEIKSKDSEAGPSGGMMMALMTYNAITKQDLTHGKKIVGTGTISLDGTVGKIGGIKYKVMGAARDKADVFLVPKDNYEEAIKVKEEKKYKLEIVKVETLQDAINYLENLDD